MGTEKSRTEKTRIDKNGVVVVVSSAAPTASVLHELDMMAFDRVVSTGPHKAGKRRESGIEADGLSLESDLSGDEDDERERQTALQRRRRQVVDGSKADRPRRTPPF